MSVLALYAIVAVCVMLTCLLDAVTNSREGRCSWTDVPFCLTLGAFWPVTIPVLAAIVVVSGVLSRREGRHA